MRTCLLVSFLVAAACVRAETPEQFFDQANQAYQQEKFSEAVEKYEAILAAGLVSGEMFYNLGNAYYKAGNLGKAILNYERALRLLPNDEDVLHNLQLAKLLIPDRLEPMPQFFLWEWWDTARGWFSLPGITWWGYLFYLLVVCSIAMVALAPVYTLRRAGFIAGLFGLAFFVLCVVLFLGKLNDVHRTDVGIITATVTTVKNTPDTKGTDAFVLHSGVKVWITDKLNNWVKIRLVDGKVGWMEEGAVEII